jgi:hypothetical protein
MIACKNAFTICQQHSALFCRYPRTAFCFSHLSTMAAPASSSSPIYDITVRDVMGKEAKLGDIIRGKSGAEQNALLYLAGKTV